MILYTISRNLDFNTECARCHTPLMVGVQFMRDGESITVGRECAKYYGITWTAKVGPLADDHATFSHAVDIIKARAADWKHGYRWPNGYDDAKQTKDALGYLAWRRAELAAMK